MCEEGKMGNVVSWTFKVDKEGKVGKWERWARRVERLGGSIYMEVRCVNG